MLEMFELLRDASILTIRTSLTSPAKGGAIQHPYVDNFFIAAAGAYR